MLTRILYKITKGIMSIYLPYLIVIILIFTNLIYFIIGEWLFTYSNINHINSIFSLMNVAATTFAAITAAILVANWRTQHNLLATSKLVTEIWDYHHKLEYEIYNLAYNYDLERDQIINSYKNTIKYAHELRTKTKHARILFNAQYDLDAIENLQEYLYYLESFQSWHEFDYSDFQEASYEAVESYKEISSTMKSLFEDYLYLK